MKFELTQQEAGLIAAAIIWTLNDCSRRGPKETRPKLEKLLDKIMKADWEDEE